MEKGTGLMMVCTWGDMEDIEKWKSDKLDTKLIIDKNGRVIEKGGKYQGMKLKNVRDEILKDLEQHRRPKLVLLGEWGEEFRGPGYRKRFTELAKSVAGYTGPVLPADLGMRIQLDDRCRVWCPAGKDGEWAAPQDVVVADWGQWIEYHAPQAMNTTPAPN